MDLTRITDRLNNAEPTIDFTYENNNIFLGHFTDKYY